MRKLLDRDGYSALGIAKKNNHEEISAQLEERIPENLRISKTLGRYSGKITDEFKSTQIELAFNNSYLSDGYLFNDGCTYPHPGFVISNTNEKTKYKS